jgi:hypothetical protein
MRRRLGSLLVGVGAASLAVFTVPAATATAGASSSAHTFTLTSSGTSTLVVGTTHWITTGTAGPSTTFVTTGTHTLSAAGAVASTAHTPDAAVEDHRATTTLPQAPGASPRGTLGQKHGPTGHLVSVVGTTVSGPTVGLTSVGGINAYDQGSLHPNYKATTPQPLPGVDVEPPDQGLCAGNGMIMEVNNMVAQVFTEKSMKPLGGARGMALEKLFKTPEVFGATGGGTLSVQGDPRCYYTPSTKRWFASQIWLTELGVTSKFSWAGELVAVSATTTPLGSWTVFFIPDQFNAKGIDHCNNLPITTLVQTATGKLVTGPADPCYGDQPLLGVDGNAVFISVNEFGLYKATGPFGVATEYVLSKTDLVAGTASPIYWGHLGDTVTRPTAGTCPSKPTGTTSSTGTALHCPFYSIVPANSDGVYLTKTGGTFYSLSNVTFTTSGGHQIAVWQFTNTDAVTTSGPHVTGSMTIVTTGSYTEPPNASQKSGPIPLGTYYEQILNAKSQALGITPPFRHPRPLPEGPIATNTDRVTTAAYDPATGALWGALNTGLRTTNSSQDGVFWVSAIPSGSGASLSASTAISGYLAAKGADIQFPGIAFTNSGKGLLDFSLSGSAYYPSTAYSMVGSNGPSGIYMASAGVGPQDGFSEYTPTYHTPRWGDYSTALATGTTFFFATEKINQSCSPGQFKATFTCGGTRDATANWGTSVNRLG